MGTMGRLVCHVCSLSPGTLRGVPGGGLSVMFVVCPLVLWEGCRGEACLCLCSLSPGVESWVPWGRLVLSCFCYCVVCLAVKQGEPPEKAMPPLPFLPHHSIFLTVFQPLPTHSVYNFSHGMFIILYKLVYISCPLTLLSYTYLYTLSSLTMSHKPFLAGCEFKWHKNEIIIDIYNFFVTPELHSYSYASRPLHTVLQVMSSVKAWKLEG